MGILFVHRGIVLCLSDVFVVLFMCVSIGVMYIEKWVIYYGLLIQFAKFVQNYCFFVIYANFFLFPSCLLSVYCLSIVCLLSVYCFNQFISFPECVWVVIFSFAANYLTLISD